MRSTTKTTRFIKVGVASVGLAAMAVTSACTPVAAVTHAASKSTTKSAAHTPMPRYSSPSQTRQASIHNVITPAISGYPWANDQTNGSDPYGMTMRQCVSFAAWYINAHGTPFGHFTKGPKGVGTFGDASTWDSAARTAGFTVSSRPLVGSIAQWHANEKYTVTSATGWFAITAGSAGHVAVVTKVYSDGSVDLAQYNLSFNRSFNALTKVKAPRYIYVPLASPSVP